MKKKKKKKKKSEESNKPIPTKNCLRQADAFLMLLWHLVDKVLQTVLILPFYWIFLNFMLIISPNCLPLLQHKQTNIFWDELDAKFQKASRKDGKIIAHRVIQH